MKTRGFRTKGIPNRNTTGGVGSAASMCGRFGYKEPPKYIVLGDGGFRAFCLRFNKRFDEKARTDRPEWMPFVNQGDGFNRSF